MSLFGRRQRAALVADAAGVLDEVDLVQHLVELVARRVGD